MPSLVKFLLKILIFCRLTILGLIVGFIVLACIYCTFFIALFMDSLIRDVDNLAFMFIPFQVNDDGIGVFSRKRNLSFFSKIFSNFQILIIKKSII